MKSFILFAILLGTSPCEALAVNSSAFRTAWSYVDCCCFTLSKEQFAELLQEDVRLIHQTNEEEPFIAQGKETVVSLFQQYIFGNSSEIAVKGVDIFPCEDGIFLKLLVEETKRNDGISTRYFFEEGTKFQFDGDKIILIQTHVHRRLRAPS